MYDDLLTVEMPARVQLIAFADDVAKMSSVTVPVLLKESLGEAFQTINNWMSVYGSQLAAEKTKALVITKRRVRDEISVSCAGSTIRSKPGCSN